MYVTNTFWTTLCAVFGQKNDTNSIPMLRKWQEYEGGNAEWNPLNSTDKWDGSTDYNAAGVQNYRSEADGVNATAYNLRRVFDGVATYPAICANLATDAPLSAWTTPQVIAEVRTWGTHGFADYLQSLTPTPQPIPPTPTPTTGDDMYMYQDANGTIWAIDGGTKLAFANIADVEVYQKQGYKLFSHTEFTPEWNTQLAKYPAL